VFVFLSKLKSFSGLFFFRSISVTSEPPLKWHARDKPFPDKHVW
jgi:hypothetical protein